MKTLNSKVLRFIGTVSRSINSKSDKKYKQLGLQKGQYMFLTRICENPEINLAALSNVLKVDKATTTKAVNKLAEIGYIVKRRSSVDKREFKLSPTRKGVSIYDVIIAEERKQLDIILEHFSDQEIETVTYLIEKMSLNSEAYWLDTDCQFAASDHE